MQELIEWGDKMLLKHPQKILGFGEVIDKAEELLEKEKEQIIDAYIEGYTSWDSEMTSLEYYTKTYKKKE